MKQVLKQLLILGATALVNVSCGAASTSAPSSPPAGSSTALTNAAAAPAPVAPAPAVATSGEQDPETLYRPINLLLKGGRDFERGQSLFTNKFCVMCHRFGTEGGGIGPDITGVGGRMDTREILESIILPSKIVSDIYSRKIYTLTDGRVVTGKPMGELDGEQTVSKTLMLDANTKTMQWGQDLEKFKVNDIDTTEEDPVSPMWTGLIISLKNDEIADLMAYLISGGDRDNRMFWPLTNSATATPSSAPATPGR